MWRRAFPIRKSNWRLISAKRKMIDGKFDRDGSRFWANGMLVALRDQNENLLGFGKILRNRTDLREQFEALRNQVEALAAADQQKNNFLATLSHELRNPLASICTAVELISRTLSRERQCGSFAQAHRGAAEFRPQDAR